MRNIDEPLLNTIVNIMATGGKSYCIPSNNRLLKILAKRYHMVITERTMRRHLVELEVRSYIWRQGRWQKASGGLPRRLSAIIHFTSKAAYYIRNFSRLLSKRLFALLNPFKIEHTRAADHHPVEDVIKQRDADGATVWLDEINKIIGFREESVVV